MKTKYAENFTLKHLLLFEICTREICEKFVYKHLETTEYVRKNLPTFYEIYKLHWKITREFLGLRIRNFHGSASIWTKKTHSEIFKSALVYLYILKYSVLSKPNLDYDLVNLFSEYNSKNVIITTENTFTQYNTTWKVSNITLREKCPI